VSSGFDVWFRVFTLGAAIGCGLVGGVFFAFSTFVMRALGRGVLHVLGNVLVTMAFNVPRNDALARVDPASAPGAEVWASYLTGWTAWNHVRATWPHTAARTSTDR
jgi:uncharacterized membrane protein